MARHYSSETETATLAMVLCTYNPKTWKIEARGPQGKSQPGLHIEFPPKKIKSIYCIKQLFVFETGFCSVSQAGLKFMIFLPQPPWSWDCRSVPPNPRYTLFSIVNLEYIYLFK